MRRGLLLLLMVEWQPREEGKVQAAGRSCGVGEGKGRFSGKVSHVFISINFEVRST